MPGRRLPRCGAQIVLCLQSSREAQVVLEAIKPDNFPLPPGMDISMEITSGSRLKVSISCVECNIMRLVATIDDVLEAAKLSSEVYQM